MGVEDLSIKGMVRNHNLANKILDVSWRKFLRLLEFKAERAEAPIVRVNPKGTSKEGDEELDRHYRASLNILNRGLSVMGQPYGPAEIAPLLRFVSASTIIEAGSQHYL